MNRFWERVEYYNSKLIPSALIVLLGLIVFELFVPIENTQILFSLKVLDGLVVTIFVIDLSFLAYRARSMTDFLKHYWLDILAVFPFALGFEFVGRFYQVVIASERISVGQAILHEGLQTEKGITAATNVSKFSRAGRVVRIVARGVRLITKSRLFCLFDHRERSKRKMKTRKR